MKGHLASLDPRWLYPWQVRDGEVAASEPMRALAARYCEYLEKGRQDAFLSIEHANDVVSFMEFIPMPGSEDLNFVLLPWQHFLITTYYGWVDRVTGRRLHRTIYLMTGRGSGKTPLISAMLIHHLLTYQSMDTDAWIVAETADQAQIVMQYILSSFQKRDELNNLIHVSGGLIRPDKFIFKNPDGKITGRRINRFTGRSKRGKGKSGLRPSMVVADEYQEHTDQSNFDLLVSGIKNRMEPIVCITCNAGYGHGTFAHREYDYAMRIAMGEVDYPSYLPFIFQVDKDDNPMEDSSCWIKSNPSLPHTPGVEYIQERVLRAKTMPSEKNEVERVCFSRWQEAGTPGLAISKFIECERDDLSPPERRHGRPCILGLDLSATTDLTALAAAWDMGDHIEAEVTVWLPREVMHHRGEEDNQPYLQYLEEGYMEQCPGAVMDYGVVAASIAAYIDSYDVRLLAYDRWNAAELFKALASADIRFGRDQDAEGLWMVEHPQGWRGGVQAADAMTEDGSTRTMRPWMPRSWRSFARELAAGTLHVRRNPLLRVGTCGIVISMDAAGNALPDRRRSLVRIDPGIALVMAVGALVDYRRYDGEPAPVDIRNWIL